MAKTWIDQKILDKVMSDRDVKVIQESGGIDAILEGLHTSKNGLSQDRADFEDRQTKYGKNQFPAPKTKSFMSLWMEAFNDKTLIILLVLAVISLVVAFTFDKEEELAWIDGAAILMTVVVVTLVSSFNTWSQEIAFQKLNERQKERMILVIRDGVTVNVSIFDLQVGDIFVVQTGEILPADGLCIESSNIQMDEAPMTGESDLIRKNPETSPFMLCGCKVQTGMGKMVVIAVGMHTQFGIIKSTILENAKERQPTPLQQKLADLSDQIGNIGFIAAAFTLVLLISFWGIALYKEPELWEGGKYLKLLIEYFIVAVTIIVVAVPEGLPLAVTISLAYSMKKMLTDNNLVRRLESCETMGGATTICSDKTGTLTENKMKVTQGFFNGKYHDNLTAFGIDSSDRKAKVATKLPSIYVNLLAEAISCNSSANLKEADNEWQYLGNVTECAMLLMLKQAKQEYVTIRERETTVQTFPFSSEKKRMTVVVAKPNAFRGYTKGASEIILTLCTRMVSQADDSQSITTVPIDAEKRKDIEKVINTLACQGLRTIAIAYRDHPKETVKAAPNGAPFPEDNAPEEDLTLIGICGIKDPLRGEVPEAIEDCHSAHIVVRMVTGDNIDTAMSIAKEAGIYQPEKGIAIEGPVFRNLSEEDRLKLIPRLQVMARSSPIDKHTLVSGLQKMGHVVAVTGDGTNDAPALSKADVGFAMGIAGTEVAKDASAIVITDDNFASIVKAGMWGRNVFDSIRKFIQFQLTVNLVAISINVIGAIFAITPLKAVQMLWVNLIMDTLAALALATEPPLKSLLDRRPYGKEDSIISASMWRNIIIGTVYQICALLITIFAWGAADATRPCPLAPGDEIECSHLLFPNSICRKFLFDEDVRIFSLQHFAFVFNTFIWMQLANEIASRKCYNELNFFSRITHSPQFLTVMVVTAVLQVILMTVPPLTTIFGIIPISPRLWIWSIAIGFLILPVQFVFRALIPSPNAFLGGIPFPGEEDEVQKAKGSKSVKAKAEKGDYVPAGVYKLGGTPPPGCTLPETATAAAAAEPPKAPTPVPYKPVGKTPKMSMAEVVMMAMQREKRFRGHLFPHTVQIANEGFISSDYSANARVSSSSGAPRIPQNFAMKSGGVNKFKQAAALGSTGIKQRMQKNSEKEE